MNKKFTGERLVTSVFNGNTINHLHRYAIASSLISGKTVLDIASGEGYGSYLMSFEALKVVGVDIDKESINNAKNKYSRSNLEFHVGSTSNIPLTTNSFDIVISFETLEHHDEHEQMMTEINRVLKPEGLLIISTPDKYFYSDLRKYKNTFHVKELYKNEFTELISAYFKNYILLSQSYINGSSLIVDDSLRGCFDFYTGDFSKIKNQASHPNYLIAISSNSELPKMNNSIFDGSRILDNHSNKKLNNLYNSKTYRIGLLITAPFKFLKRLF